MNKKYKFLKDCLFLHRQINSIIQEEDLKGFSWISIGFLEYEWYIEEVIEKPKTLKDLKVWDRYYYTDLDDISSYFVDESTDFKHDDYPTYEQAEKELRFRQAKRKVEDFISLWWDLKIKIIFEWDRKNIEIHDEILYLTNFYN